MMYGVEIGFTVDTKRDYGLILCNDLSIPMPEPRYKFVEVPEMDGAIDMSESLTGHLTYSQRKITFTLFAAYDVIRGTDRPPNERTFQELKARFSDAFHGKYVSIKFPDDPDGDFYFRGRLTVGEKSGYNSGKIPITIMAEPYKYGTVHQEIIEGYATREIINPGATVYPLLTASDSSILYINGDGFSVPEGVSRSQYPLINGLNIIEKDPPGQVERTTIQIDWDERKF